MKNRLSHLLLKAFNSKYREINFEVYEVVSEGLTASKDLADGKLLPSIIIDTKDNMSIPELIKFHIERPSGDTVLRWHTIPQDTEIIILHLKFTNPMAIEFGIIFKIEDHYNMIDGIIHSRGLILLAGKERDKVSNLDIPRITVEVPSMGFDNKWNELLLRAFVKRLRKLGVSKSDLKEMAQQQINSNREIWRYRRE